MDTNWFSDLAAVAHTRSFSKAAVARNISQSALSRHIRALETWVGTPLVDRSSYPVRLTRAGRQMLEAGTQAATLIETERDRIRQSLAQPDRYVVTFGAQHSIGWRFFPVWLQAFEREFGPITSRLWADDLPDCVAALHGGEVDLVLAYESAGVPGVEPTVDTVSVRVGADALLPVCRPDEHGRRRFDLDDADATSIPYLRFGPSAPILEHLAAVLSTDSLASRLECVYENSMAGALRIRALDGLGVAWLPCSLVESDLASGALTVAGDSRWWIDLQIRLHRLERNRNRLVLRIWRYLSGRQDDPLFDTSGRLAAELDAG